MNYQLKNVWISVPLPYYQKSISTQLTAIMPLNLHKNVCISVTLGVQNTQGMRTLRVFF
jgi:hypothetical protein